MKIIDISSAGQRDANLAEAFANGISAAIFRMGYGSDIASQDDTEFEENVRRCEEAGKPWGAYLFSYAIDEAHVRGEIAHVKRLLQGKNPKLGVWYDIEQGPETDYKVRNGFIDSQHGDELTAWAHLFIDAMQADGYRAGVYCDYYHATRIMDLSGIEHKWIAYYKSNPQESDPPMQCDLWQYTSTESVPGVDETTDVNYVYGQWIIDEVLRAEEPAPPDNEVPQSHSCIYQVFANNHWMPCVDGYDTGDINNGYAGVPGKAISGVAAHADGVTLYVKAHLKRQRRWLPSVHYHDVNDVDGYAGILGKEIDAIQMWTEEGREVRYQVSTKEHGYYPAVYGSRHDNNDRDNGYAGVFGETIDRVLCQLI